MARKSSTPAGESPTEREQREAMEETLGLIEQCDALMAEYEALTKAGTTPGSDDATG